METSKSYRSYFIILLLLLVITFVLNISLGSVSIPLSEVIYGLFGSETTKPSWQFILLDYRLPKAITAILAGGGLAVSGLLMQTLFRNPPCRSICIRIK